MSRFLQLARLVVLVRNQITPPDITGSDFWICASREEGGRKRAVCATALECSSPRRISLGIVVARLGIVLRLFRKGHSGLGNAYWI